MNGLLYAARPLISDFFPTIVFAVLIALKVDVRLATGAALAIGLAQVAIQSLRRQKIELLQWASLGLVLLFGALGIITNDARFLMAKPTVIYLAVGAVMLKRGWMLRYMPAIVTDTVPEYVTFAGYAWAALCFVLGAGTIAVAMTGDMKLWTFYVTVVLVGAKIAAFAIQYAAFRLLVGSRIRAAARA